MASNNSWIQTSPSPTNAPKQSLSFKSLRSPKKCSTSSTSSSIPPPQLPPPGSPPPPRPPRPKTSLPNLRPTIILSPLAIPSPCAFRIPSPNSSARSFRFSDEVFASLPEHLRLLQASPHSSRANDVPRGHSPDLRSLRASPSQMCRAHERLKWSAFAQLLSSRIATKSQSHHIPEHHGATLENSKTIRAMDSFERAIFLSRPSNIPTRLPLATSQMSTSPARSNPEKSVNDLKSNNDEAALEGGAVSRRRRRPFCMLATVFFVVMAASAIAGGVIWKLTTCKSDLETSLMLRRRQLPRQWPSLACPTADNLAPSGTAAMISKLRLYGEVSSNLACNMEESSAGRALIQRSMKHRKKPGHTIGKDELSSS